MRLSFDAAIVTDQGAGYSSRPVVCAASDATASMPAPELSQFEQFTELLTTLFPVWVRLRPSVYVRRQGSSVQCRKAL